MQNKTKLPLFEMAAMIVGEIITSVLIVAMFMIVNFIKGEPLLHYSVPIGALLGSTITVVNFFLLSILTTRTVNKALASRGSGEMTDEEAETFAKEHQAKEHQAKVQFAMTVSYVIRIATMVVALIVAFIFKEIFNPIATIVPIFMMRPILTVTQLILNKKEGKNG